jgi:Uma2 family endonuclease
MATAEALMTAEEYLLLPDDGTPNELVRGRVVPVNMPKPRHGEICANIVFLLGSFAREHGLGRVICNDSGVITERDPDTVRGADVAFYSYLRMPKGPAPRGYPAMAPDLVFEVRSPGDRWRDILEKVLEYLDAGVTEVCVVDEVQQTIHLYSAEQPDRILTADEELSLPDILGDLRLKVQQLFD